jgi:mannose-6-phosphate isomerase-like protein (cupin superfamily)
MRKLGRWFLWALGAVVLVAVGLAVADTVRTRSCPAGDFRGRVVQIPGERMEFLETGVETDGRRLSFDTIREPFEDPQYELHAADGHVHPDQEEYFEIIEGSARFLIGDRQVVLTPGQSAVVPPNTIHHWMALDGRPVRVKAEYRPALNTAEWFASFHGHLERDDMTLIQAVVIQSEFYEGAPWPSQARPLWKALVRVLAPIGRLMGYKAC